MRHELIRYRIQQYISDVHALAMERKTTIWRFAQPRSRVSTLRGQSHSVSYRMGKRGAVRVWELVMGGLEKTQ